MTEQLTLTCASKADLLADLGDHFDSLGLTLPDFTFSLSGHPSGIAEAVMGDGARVLISVQEAAPPRPLAANIVIEGEAAALWRERFHVPLAAPDTTVIPATRGDLEVPATARGTGTVRPRTPSHVIAGIPPLPPLDEGEAEAAEEWVQRTPGVANGYMRGQMARRAGKVWVQPLDLPESAPGALNGGSYADPAAPASGWITQFADAEPIWAAGDVYTQPIVVRHLSPSDGLVHRYQLQVASETALVGREPHQAVMWAVWLDLGVAP